MSKREIKFRGMSIMGEWFYGNLALIKKKVNHIQVGSYISNSVGMPFAYLVRPETVGQLTGLLDKNGKEIYEGDIFQFHYEDGPGGRGVVFWHDEMAAWMWHPTDHDESMSTLMPEYQVMEVIGSIYETPELLK